MYFGRENWNISPADTHGWNSCSHNQLLEGIVFNLLYPQASCTLIYQVACCGFSHSVRRFILTRKQVFGSSKFSYFLQSQSVCWCLSSSGSTEQDVFLTELVETELQRYPRNSCFSRPYWSLKWCKLVSNRNISIWEHCYGYVSLLVCNINSRFYFPSQWPASNPNGLLEFWGD